MELSQEKLVSVVARLADCYTSKESSSVTYETAHMLMEAVLYCIDETMKDDNGIDKNLPDHDSVDPVLLYNQGYKIVNEKVYHAKAIYERIIKEFDDYECKNYHDTILRGMPGFFIRYDSKYCPQDHILTLDYPTMYMNNQNMGIDRILNYLTCIEKEKIFLDLFEHSAVVALLEKVQIDYRELFLDNICSIVLLQAIGCAIADKPIFALQLNKEDCDAIAYYFEGDSRTGIEFKIIKLIELITRTIKEYNLNDYLIKESKNYASRIVEGIKHESLCNVFIVESC